MDQELEQLESAGEIPTTIPTVIYQQLTPTDNPKISRSRVRTFYRYGNRNRSFFSDEVSEQLIRSAAYTPVVGKYSVSKKDFEGHSKAEETKMYGIIPPDSHFAWEWHLDKDDQKREYACFDIILATEYFQEANQIVGKAQSMELNSDTIQGSWQQIQSDPSNNYTRAGTYYVYSQASLKGLCVLGDNVEPCFEGASFFEQENPFYQFMFTFCEAMRQQPNTISVLKQFKDDIVNDVLTAFSTGKQLDIINPIINEDENINTGGDKPMSVNVNGLGREDYSLFWANLNPQFNEEGNFTISEVPIAFDEKGETITTYAFNTGNIRRMGIQNSTDGEKLSPAHYEVKQEFKLSDLETEKTEFAVKLAESEAANATLQSNFEAIQTEFEQWKSKTVESLKTITDSESSSGGSRHTEETVERVWETIENYAVDMRAQLDVANARIAELEQYKLDSDAAKVDELLNSYKVHLDEDELQPIVEARSNYSFTEIEQQLALAFSRKTLRPRSQVSARVPLTDNTTSQSGTGLEALLKRYFSQDETLGGN